MPTINVDHPIVRYTPYATIVKPTFSTSDSSSVAWSTPTGSVSPTPGISTVLTFPNQTRSIIVIGGAMTKAVQVYATIPFQPYFGYELDIDNNTLRSPAEDGGAVLRVKGPIKRNWQVAFNNIPYDEWPLLRDFFNFHQKHIAFYYEDLAVPENLGSGEANILTLVTFDAGLKITVAGPQRFNITTAFREA